MWLNDRTLPRPHASNANPSDRSTLEPSRYLNCQPTNPWLLSAGRNNRDAEKTTFPKGTGMTIAPGHHSTSESATR